MKRDQIVDNISIKLKENFDIKYLDCDYVDIAHEILLYLEDIGMEIPKETKSNDMVIMFDVDDTLVIWDYPKELDEQTINFDNYGFNVRLLPHKKHIEQMKRHAARGHKVIVWSAGGEEWAREVVKTLGLEQYVYDVICKPQFYYDDLTPEEFLPISNRVYYNYKTDLETTNSYVNIETGEDDQGYGG